MNREKATVVWASLISAVIGAVVMLVFVESSHELQSRNQFKTADDSNKPPKPEWKTQAKSTEQIQQPLENSITDSQLRTARFPKPTLENPPETKQVREEAATNLHGTPQALLEFAEQLAKSMEGAFADQETRYTVSRQLIACARDAQARGSAQAARALCLANLERLKSKFPEELSPSYQALVAELPDDLLFVAGIQKTSEEK